MRSFDPIPLRRQLDHAVEALRRHFGAIFLPVALPMALAGLVLSIAQVWWMQSMTTFEGAGGVGFFGVIVLFGIAVLVAIAVQIVAYTALMVATMDAVAGRPLSMAGAWRSAVRPAILLPSILFGLLTMASLFACILPVLYVAPLLSFALPAVIDERLGAGAALGRSVELANFNPSRQLGGYPWLRALTVLFAWMLISNALTSAVQLPFIGTQQFLILRETLGGGAADPQAMTVAASWLQVPATVLGMLATVVGWMFLSFAICGLFVEVRRLKEGADLEVAIRAMTRSGEATGPAPTRFDPPPEPVA